MPRDLLVVGTGGLAKEAAQLARRMDPAGARWPSIGYVTHLPEELGARLPFGEVRELDAALAQRAVPADVVIGVGHPGRRRDLALLLAANPVLAFPNLVHPDVEIDAGLVTLGRGNMVTRGVVMTCDIRIGDFNLVNWNSTIGHDCVVGSYNVINPGSSVSGRVRLGDACLLGTGCRILETLEIASDVTIGAGAVVTRSIGEPGTWLGVPARRAPS
jgi:sugar O-acyltransferase (sialic acid O-acetyltransferase NeuD family)